MVVRLGPFGLVDWRQPAGAILLTTAVFFLELASPALCALSRCIWAGIQRAVIVPSAQSRVRERLSGRRRDGAGDTDPAHAAPDAREHAPELALDAGFGRGSRLLGLCALHCLWQRRDAALGAAHVLNCQQVSLVAQGARRIFAGSVSSIVRGWALRIVVGNRRWWRAFIVSRSVGRLLLRLVLGMEMVHP